MSQDLFAAFGDTERESPIAVGAPEHAGTIDDDDDFGEFEDASAPAMPQVVSKAVKPLPFISKTASSSFPPKVVRNPVKETGPPPDPSIGKHPFADHMDLLFAADADDYDAGIDEMGDLSSNPAAAMAFSKRIIAEQEAQAKRQPVPVAESMPAESSPPPVRDPNILFDVDNLSGEEDDFGDFEAGFPSQDETKLKQDSSLYINQKLPNIDLLGLDDGTVAQPAGERRNRTRPVATSAETRSQPNTYTEDDAWDDFEETEPASHPTPAISSNVRRGPPGKTPQLSVRGTDESLPPTNVPPPAMLLSIYPSLFASSQEALFDPLGKLDARGRQELLSHAATHQFLRGHLNVVIVLAHIIAGRRSRWKRDQHLAQSMRIGPSGGKSGMKLAGLDKGEVAKEDREVLDAVRLWRAQMGKLRGVVTTVNSALRPGEARLPPVPEIADHMPVRALKPAEGGITAPHACALCGLRREERVVKVDVDVDDSFGEWWVQNMHMHLRCRHFWDEHKDKLRSR